MALQDSLSRLAGTSLDFVQARLELIAIDLEDSAWRIGLLVSISVMAALLLVLAVVFASLAFIVTYWENNPVWALSVVAIGYGVCGLGLFTLVIRRFRQSSFLMSDSIQMLREDRQMLRDLP